MMKKLVALILAVVMIMAMGATALASVDPVNGSYEGSKDNVTSGITEVPITKSLIIFNPEDGTNVREPNIKFVYTVTPVTDSSKLGTITDDGRNNKIGGTATPVTVHVNAGVDGAVTGTTISFGEASTASAKSTGTEVEKTANLGIDLTGKFNHAGVYRYLITESVQDLAGNTITDVATYGLETRTSDYDATRYLDLYVANDGADSFKVVGATIFKTNTKDDSDNSATDAITTTTDKTTGFEPGTSTPSSGDPDYTNDKEVDRYFTYNLKVGKTTTGNLADKSHDFPFEIKLTGAGTLVPTVKTDLTVNNATNISAGEQNISTTVLTLSPRMSNGDYIELKGIPKGTTVTVKETNDTPDVYTASWDAVSGTTSTSVTAQSDNTPNTDLNLANGKSAFTSAAVAIDGNQTTEYVKTVLGFTNTIAEISQTGVVMRVAPYALILAAGMVLVLISRRRKAEEE